jgi:tetratricopeptide (TPR) repeat protein
MPSRTAFLCVLQLILGTSAFAQNASSAASKDCQSSDTNRRLSGCTEVINARGYGSQSNLADALDGRCWAYNDKEQFTLGIADCKASIHLRPRNFYAHNNLGTAYAGLGNYEDALSAFDMAIELKPDFYWSHFNRAKLLIAVGRKEDAIRDYEYLLKRDPRNQEIRNLLNGLRAEIATQPVPNLPSLLRSLPSDVQKEIKGIRQSCRELGPATSDYTPPRVTEGDEGLITFTVSGAQAVLIDELNFCGGGGECIHGVNCATGFTHNVAIYIRTGAGTLRHAAAKHSNTRR